MNAEIITAWLLLVIPLSISPGPANILFAASGSAFGVKATAPFWVGTNLICLLQSLAVGLGLGAFLLQYPDGVLVIKYAGVGVLLYLAFRFFRSSVALHAVTRPLGFKDGVLIELLNVKFLLIPMVMFSQFYRPEVHGWPVLAGLTVALGFATMVSNFLWMVGGNALTAFISEKTVARYQGLFFGGILVVTALWFALS